MDWLTDWIDGWVKQGLIDAIMANFSNLFDAVNNRVGEIAVNVGQTPQGWNPAIFTMIKNLSDTAILPIAGMILTFVLCFELIQTIIEKNNMHEFYLFDIYKWVFKTFIAVYILSHTFDIVMGVFELAQSVVNTSAGVVRGSLDINAAGALANLEAQLEAMGLWELIGLYLESFILGLCLTAMTIFIFVIIFGRMLEVYLTMSMAPIPFATMINRDWGQIGNNYLKTLFALAFQGFLIMVCVAIYAVLIQSIPAADNVHGALWGTAAYTFLLCLSLMKTGSLSRSIFGAH